MRYRIHLQILRLQKIRIRQNSEKRDDAEEVWNDVKSLKCTVNLSATLYTLRRWRLFVVFHAFIIEKVGSNKWDQELIQCLLLLVICTSSSWYWFCYTPIYRSIKLKCKKWVRHVPHVLQLHVLWRDILLDGNLARYASVSVLQSTKGYHSNDLPEIYIF